MINVTVQGFVKAFDTKGPLKAELHIKEIGTENGFVHESNPIDGLYSIVLAAGKKYEVKVLHDQYLSETLQFDFEKQDRYLEIKQDILLKSEYVLNLTVADRDLKTPLTAYLSVSGSPSIYQDTLKAAQNPVKLTLKAGHQYELKASASYFPLVAETWKFDPRLFQPEMSHTINLVHEKVKYLADVTNIVSHQKTKMKVHFTNEKVDEVIVAESGDAVYLRKGDRYQVMTSSDKGYFFSTSTIVAGEGQPNENGVYSINMTVIPIEEGAQITLNQITFDFNSAVLDESSFAELDRVVELLTKNPSLNIEIAAHTDDVGSDDYNLRLSEKRALGVVDYLARKGAEPGRLKPIGYGKTRPLLSNETDENRSKNRRVELRVLKFN
jgi:outer membrane protein OmpA-like peptidoglycan-associated protein